MTASELPPPPQTTTTRTPGRHGGRRPTSGRGLVAVGRSAAISVHTGSGLPFGHVPAYLPGSSSLVEELEKRLLIVLRDGKHIIGTLTSFDQFSNLVLRDAVERRMVRTTTAAGTTSKQQQCFFCDVPMGIYVVRGDSMVLCGVHDNTFDNGRQTAVTLQELQELQGRADPLPQWDFDTDLTA